jgi:hypothetical protein
MTTLALLNQATTMRNLDRNRALRARQAGDLTNAAKFATLMLAWETKARTYTNTVGTRLVSMPDNAAAIVAEIFVSRLPR